MTTPKPDKPFATNVRSITKLAIRKMWKGTNRPLAMVAWQGGYEGETIISFVPRAAPVAALIVGVAGAITGIAGEFTGVHLSPKDIEVIKWAIGIGTCTYTFGKYVDTQLDKIKGYIDDPARRDYFAGSILVGNDIVTASQAATLGRLIHQIGYGIMGKLGIETDEAETDKIVPVPRKVETLSEPDQRGLIHDYKQLCKLIALADREGFEKVDGWLPQNFGDRFLKPIHKAFGALAVEAKHGQLCDWYRQAQREHLPQASAMLSRLDACTPGGTIGC